MLILMAALVGCATPVNFGNGPVGVGGGLVADDRGRVWVVYPERGAISLTDVNGGEPRVIEMDEPVALVLSGASVFVAEAASGEIVVLDGDGTEVERRVVGSEPRALAVHPVDGRLLVALAGDNRVVALERTGLREVARWEVAGHPTGLALHPTGVAYATCAHGERAWVLGPGGVEALDLPTIPVFDGTADRAVRASGAPTVSRDGTRLAVPVLLTDNVTLDPETDTSSYTNPEIVRFVSAVALFELDQDGFPTGASGLVFTRTEFRQTFAPSSVRSVAFDERGDQLALAIPSDGAVVVIDGPFLLDYQSTTTFPPTIGHTMTLPAVILAVQQGVSSVAYLADGQIVASTPFVGSLGLVSAETLVNVPRVDDIGVATVDRWVSSGSAALALDTERQLGRELFHQAGGSMAIQGGGVSCAECHAAPGQTDGLTWPIGGMKLQTPMLSARAGETAPYQWDGEVATIAEEARLTSTSRMGGAGPSAVEADAIAAYVSSLRTPNGPSDLNQNAVKRGARVFAEKGCGGCHSGASYADGYEHPMLGLANANTPTLLGLSWSEPYFHDGSAATLKDVVDVAARGEMGGAFEISAGDKADLVAFLSSL